jgi:hypothetical protein
MSKTETERARKENFTSDEVEVLIQGVSKRTAIVNGKFGNGVGVTNESKNAAWESIAREVSAASGISRTADDVKRKWIRRNSKSDNERKNIRL